ncbi:sensor histidine kinase [Actinoallomurus iriomotensis]|nr:sensor histidine kinase [Actinoallomurus iriomotensis]
MSVTDHSNCGEVRRLAEERGALQHVATLVARGASPSVIFNAAACALGGLIKADYTAINRYEGDRTMSIMAFWRAPGTPDIGPPFGGRWTLGDDTPSAAVLRGHRPSSRASATINSDIGGWHREHRIGHVVACPVIVDDHLWGTMTALYLGAEPPKGDVEERMGKFVELLNCAIIQAKTRCELIASRARLVTSADATRRRIERDLHDGAQQHLISLALRLREAEESVPPGNEELRRRLSEAVQDLTGTIDELREVSVGLRPPTLAARGLDAALTQLVARSPVPVELHIDADRRLDEEIEVSLYYVVSEALTNVLKHANASTVSVDLAKQDSQVRLAVRDDGVGGADPTRGSGLTGLRDRVEALGGILQITSPTGHGTSVVVTIG